MTPLRKLTRAQLYKLHDRLLENLNEGDDHPGNERRLRFVTKIANEIARRCGL